MYTEVFKHNGARHNQCGICGEYYEQEYAAICLMNDDDDVVFLGGCDVCPSCAASPAIAAERCRYHIANLRAHADALVEHVLPGLPEAHPWATVEELEQAHREVIEGGPCPS